MNSQNPYLQAILREYPDFPVHSAESNDVGQNSAVLILNGGWIFRFPRYEQGRRSLEREAAVLGALDGRLPLPIPHFTYRCLDAAKGESAFVGYRMIPGEPLWRQSLHAVQDDAALNRLAAQLANFLRDLHAAPPEIIPLDLPRAETRDSIEDIYRRIREKLFSFMRPDAREKVTAHFESFLDDARHFDYPPALRHADFGASNILFDPARQVVTGIIDFSFAGPGDPACDYAGLLASYGESFLERVYTADPGAKALADRAHFYRGIYALEEALFGIENGDDSAFRAGMENYV